VSCVSNGYNTSDDMGSWVEVDGCDKAFPLRTKKTERRVWVVLPDNVNISRIYSIRETDAAAYLPVISHKI
jgi:hypothetical protein